MTYQKKTGSLMANSHPGSYCGQDAYNDMFVTEIRNVGILERTGQGKDYHLEKCGGVSGCRIRNIFKQ